MTFPWWKGDDRQCAGPAPGANRGLSPFPAVAILRAEVYPKLKYVLPPDVWEYATK
jgi:hypothetical protein